MNILRNCSLRGSISQNTGTLKCWNEVHQYCSVSNQTSCTPCIGYTKIHANMACNNHDYRVKMNVIDYITITCNLKNGRLQITSDDMKKCNLDEISYKKNVFDLQLLKFYCKDF
jgi:hypothetical protein